MSELNLTEENREQLRELVRSLRLQELQARPDWTVSASYEGFVTVRYNGYDKWVIYESA